MADKLEKLKKPYDPQATEGRIYKLWEESGYFNPDNLPNQNGDPFTIIMPPPNANGSLHAGHAVFVTIEDLIIRYQRMKGKKTLWLPGADHAGFETQVVYEKKLEKEGRSRFGLEPEKLRQEIMDFTLHNKSFMEGQLRELGASCDWSREKFTLDPEIIATVYDTFKKLQEDGLAYRGRRSINWCTKHQTSLSELETETEERMDPLYYLKYGPFTLATVRPETKFGDTAIAVNPNDERYKDWIGKEIEFEGLIGPVKLKVIADEYVDPAFGTGVVKITPAHDPNDFAVAERHHLPAVEVIDQYGKLNERCGQYAGLKVAEARKRIVEDLEKAGLLVKIDQEYKHNVKKCYKCGQVLEPRLLPQWFIKMKPLAEPVIKALEADEITFYPDHYKKIMLHWLNNIEDWNVSRQIVWGIPIPDTPGETFDTWFSSGQWPFAVLGYPDGADYKDFYPTQLMETAGEIIFFWVARMLILGLYRTGQLPFNTVYLHGLVTAKDGEKMSKSRGNVISPLDISQKYGTDALRMGLIIGNTPGATTALSEDKIKAYKHFANKLWNISRFILENTAPADETAIREAREEALTAERQEMLESVTSHLDNYRFHLAGEELYHYTWHRLADEILEDSKKNLTPSRKKFLRESLRALLIALHPFMPFITEELWDYCRRSDDNLLLITPWIS